MITGYANNSRGVGVRSLQLILPSVVCSTHLSKKVAEEVGAITFSHQHGCGIIGPDVAGVNEFFVALAGHPNVQSTLVLGLGCETIQGNELTDSIAVKFPETRYVVIQESAGMTGALELSVEAARELHVDAPHAPLEHLVIGAEGNPAADLLDSFADLVAKAGHALVISNDFKEPSRNFAKLVREKAHVIASFPDANQPPTGLPLIPVVTIANTQSSLHQALIDDFDCAIGTSAAQVLEKLLAVANGEASKAEAKKIGNIVVPRIVRSV
jgi:altronate dehydratase